MDTYWRKIFNVMRNYIFSILILMIIAGMLDSVKEKTKNKPIKVIANVGLILVIIAFFARIVYEIWMNKYLLLQSLKYEIIEQLILCAIIGTFIVLVKIKGYK